MNRPVMNHRVTRLLLALYPRAWRDRYGAEVTSLTDELIRAGETTPLPAGLNLVAGAMMERARELAGSRNALAVMSAAVIIAMIGGAYAVTGSARPSPAPRSVAGAGCLVEPSFQVPVSTAAGARLRPAAPPRFKTPPSPARRWLGVSVAARPPVLVVRPDRVRLIRTAAPRLARPPVRALIGTAAPRLFRIAASGLVGTAAPRLGSSAKPTLALRARPESALTVKPLSAQPVESGLARTAAPVWTGLIGRSCRSSSAAQDPVSGQGQILRVRPPVPVATRVTR